MRKLSRLYCRGIYNHYTLYVIKIIFSTALNIPVYVFSTYDESLALMLLRFEGLRHWKKRGKEGPEALRIGAVIIRKLLHLTQKVCK